MTHGAGCPVSSRVRNILGRPALVSAAENRRCRCAGAPPKERHDPVLPPPRRWRPSTPTRHPAIRRRARRRARDRRSPAGGPRARRRSGPRRRRAAGAALREIPVTHRPYVLEPAEFLEVRQVDGRGEAVPWGLVRLRGRGEVLSQMSIQLSLGESGIGRVMLPAAEFEVQTQAGAARANGAPPPTRTGSRVRPRTRDRACRASVTGPTRAMSPSRESACKTTRPNSARSARCRTAGAS